MLPKRGSVRPLLVVIDDVHAADAASLLLLRFVAQELADTAVVFLVTFRDQAAARDAGVAASVADLCLMADDVMTLHGFDIDEIREFVAGAYGQEGEEHDLETIVRGTAGKPG